MASHEVQTFLRTNSQNTVPLSEDLPKTQYYDLGFVGWGGIGGSVLQASPKLIIIVSLNSNDALLQQWHPELEIGFGYAPTLLHFFDLNNVKTARLQKAVVQCVRDKSG